MDQDVAQRPVRAIATIVAVLLSALALLFLPLGLAFLESVPSRTNYVEDFCRDIGIYGFLDAIYDPILDVLR